MNIIDLTAEHEPLYFKCLIGDPARTDDAGDYKRDWYQKMKPRGLKVKLALNDADEPVGLVQYLPIEESTATGKDLYYLLCIWVVKDPKLRVNEQKKGFGTALLEAFEADARASGKKGVAAWGLSIPAFMPASWFKKHGYEEAERSGMNVLLWKTWSPGVAKPAWAPWRKKPEQTPGKSTVACFHCGWCTEVNKVFTRAKRAVAEIGGEIDFKEIDTTEQKAFEEWGISDALFIDGEEMPLGPAPSYMKIKRAIQRSQKKAAKGKR